MLSLVSENPPLSLLQAWLSRSRVRSNFVMADARQLILTAKDAGLTVTTHAEETGNNFALTFVLEKEQAQSGLGQEVSCTNPKRHEPGV
jgi:hypothetical protein